MMREYSRTRKFLKTLMRLILSLRNFDVSSGMRLVEKVAVEVEETQNQSLKLAAFNRHIRKSHFCLGDPRVA